MRFAVPIRRLVLGCLGAGFVVVGAIITLLAFPEPLYAYHVEEGRLRLYSDHPFDPARGRAILDDVERRLDEAPPALADPASVYRIFVTNEDWRKRLFFLWSYGVGGLNYYPLAGGVFVRQSDIDNDRVLKSNGTPVAPPRTLAYYTAHEIGHSLIARHVGALANWRLPAWQREGMADFIGYGGDVDIAALIRAFRAGDPDLDPKRSGTYSRYRLLVAYFLKHEGWSVDRLLASGVTRAEAEHRLMVGMLEQS